MKLLLHACCGPCAVYPIQHFLNENIDVTAYYYNPNIHPREEHTRRGDALKAVATANHIEVVYSDFFDQDTWEHYQGSMEERCNICYSMRIMETARKARKGGYDAFTTSLLISPYQDHEKIRELCMQCAKSFNIEFLYMDFRPFFRQGQQLAKELGIYRQKYCGCICSLNGNGR